MDTTEQTELEAQSFRLTVRQHGSVLFEESFNAQASAVFSEVVRVAKRLHSRRQQGLTIIVEDDQGRIIASVGLSTALLSAFTHFRNGPKRAAMEVGTQGAAS